MDVKRIKIWLVLAGYLAVSGCASVISAPVVKQADKTATPSAVQKDPAAYAGRMVIWSGHIIRTENQEQGTLIEIIQKPSDLSHRPRLVDQTDGRFLALFNGYLDTAVYEKGREVTIAGTIQGSQTLPLGQITYTYPLIAVKEHHLWPARATQIRLHDDRPLYPWYYRYPGYYYW